MPEAFVTVKTTVAVLLESFWATAAQLVPPVPPAGAHVSVIPGPTRVPTVTVPVFVPADAVTTVCTDVVSVVTAWPLPSVVANPGFRNP